MGVCASASNKDADSLTALWDAEAAKRSKPSARVRDALRQLLGPGGLIFTLQDSTIPDAAFDSPQRRSNAGDLIAACTVVFKPAPAFCAACLVRNELKPSNAAVFLLSLSA